MKTVTLICGLPNAGKTTYSRNYQNVIHLDDYRKKTFGIDCYFECADTAANTKEDVCIEGIYNTKQQRIRLLTALRLAGIPCRKVLVWLNTPMNVCMDREHNAGCKNRNVVKQFSHVFDIPTKDEGWDEIIEINQEEQK